MISPTLLDWSGPCHVDRSSGVIEAAYVKAAEQKHGGEFTFWARIDDAGRVAVAQVLRIVETVKDEHREVKLADIILRAPNAKLGEYVVNRIDAVEPDETQMTDAKTLATIRNVRISAA